MCGHDPCPGRNGAPDFFIAMRRNSPAHLKTIIVGNNVSVPVKDGELCLGIWQEFISASLTGRETANIPSRRVPNRIDRNHERVIYVQGIRKQRRRKNRRHTARKIGEEPAQDAPETGNAAAVGEGAQPESMIEPEDAPAADVSASGAGAGGGGRGDGGSRGAAGAEL